MISIRAGVVLLLLSARPAWSQDVTTVQEGSTILIQLRNATKLQVRILSIHADSVIVRDRIDGPPIAVARADVSSLQVRMPNPNRGRYALQGATLGGVAGAAILGVLLLSIDDNCSDCATVPINQTLLGAGIYIGAGAVAGAWARWIFAPAVWKPGTF